MYIHVHMDHDIVQVMSRIVALLALCSDAINNPYCACMSVETGVGY